MERSNAEETMASGKVESWLDLQTRKKDRMLKRKRNGTKHEAGVLVLLLVERPRAQQPACSAEEQRGWQKVAWSARPDRCWRDAAAGGEFGPAGVTAWGFSGYSTRRAAATLSDDHHVAEKKGAQYQIGEADWKTRTTQNKEDGNIDCLTCPVSWLL